MTVASFKPVMVSVLRTAHGVRDKMLQETRTQVGCQVFMWWDYGLTDEQNAALLHNNITRDIQVSCTSGRSRSTGECMVMMLVRVCCCICDCCSVTTIMKRGQYDLAKKKSNWKRQSLSTIAITVDFFLLPLWLCRYETPQ